MLDYREHDFIVAAISHLPHLIASSLVNLVHDCDNENQTMKRLAAGGFKDITRIASSSPVMWEQICMTNDANIAVILKRYIESLGHILTDVESKDSGAYSPAVRILTRLSEFLCRQFKGLRHARLLLLC